MALNISVIGTGYLGVVHAACMADLGHTVIAIDADAAKVRSLSRGVPPIFEPGLDELLARVLPTGRVRFTTHYAEVSDADAHFICVGTPQLKGENAVDTSDQAVPVAAESATYSGRLGFSFWTAYVVYAPVRGSLSMFSRPAAPTA